MRSVRVPGKVFVALVGTALLATGCGSDVSIEETVPSSEVTEIVEAPCDIEAIANSLSPNIPVDFDPYDSPLEIAADTAVVVKGQIGTVQADGDWNVVALESVTTLVDRRLESPEPVGFSIQAGTARPNPDADDIAGVHVLIFANEWPSVPTGLTPAVEGFWIACGPGDTAKSVIHPPIRDGWPVNPTLEDLVAAAEL